MIKSPLSFVDYKDWPIGPSWLNVNNFSLYIVTTAMFIVWNWKTILHHVGSDKQCYYIHGQRRGMGGTALRAFM
jgi:hypothetical protein